MSASTTAFSGHVPENYDRYLGPLLFEPYAMDLAECLSGRPIQTVLELACGTGRLTQHLSTIFPAATEILATDLNAGMIQVAQSRVTGKNIRWSVADMLQIPFPDQHVDLVVCQFGIMFVPDRMAAYREVKRVLKKGGHFLFNAWDTLEQNPAFLLADQIVNSYFPTDPVPFYKVPFSYHDPETMRVELTAAGFRNPVVESVKKTGIGESAEAAMLGMVNGNPAYGFICERDASQLPVIQKRLETELATRFGNHPVRIPMHAWRAEASVG